MLLIKLLLGSILTTVKKPNKQKHYYCQRTPAMGENSITYGIWKRFILSVLGAALLIVVFPDNSLAQSTYTIKPTIIEPEKLGNLGISPKQNSRI